MKYFEFNSFPYYSLIGAETADKAIECYREFVGDATEEDGMPDEIPVEDAKEKLLKACREEKGAADEVKDFEENSKGIEAFIILIDSCLAD